jgi:hypothetical protein
MEAIPRISGLDFARALMRLGHRMAGNASGYLLLERGPRAVTVPLVEELDAVLLHFLMNAAGVSQPQVVGALNTRAAPPPKNCAPRSTSSSSPPPH